MPNPPPPRERAARALCRNAGLEENIPFEGKPMWQNFLPEVDVVLKAALTAEEWQKLMQTTPKEET